ncbi:MAG: hypothetical protein RLZZ299_546 [Pseudomonadota bacterium]
MLHLARRYIVPFLGLAPRPHQLGRVLGSLADSYRADDTAAALPAAVGIDVSDACNIACAVCSREIAWDKRRHPFLRLPDFVALYDAIRPVYLSLSGYGETLLNRDLPAMVAHAARGGSRVVVITNGTLLDAARGDALREAGLAKLKVSLDAAEPAAYARVREGADLDEVVANVRAFVDRRDGAGAAGPRVEVQMVLFRDNLDQLVPMVDLVAARLPGVELNVIGMFTYGAQPGFVAKALPMHDPASLSVLAEARRRATALGMRRTVGSLDALRVQLERDLSSAPCFVPWYSCLISTDGEVYPCCYHSVRGTSVGNVHGTPFPEIWNGPRMRAFRAALRERRCEDRVCATCRYEDGPLEGIFRTAARVPGLGGASRAVR